MHLIFTTRGILQQINLFEMFMQAQMFKWGRTNLKTGKVEYVQVQGSLRKLPFGYEYVFPEECLDEVLTMLDAENNLKRWNLGKYKTFFIRMLCGKGDNGDRVMPIPKYKTIATNRYIELRGIAIYFIGIKKDSVKDCHEWGYRQEML